MFRSSYLLLLIALSLFLPFIAQAQTNGPELQNLLVEIWPEYDRPETLVIYRVELVPNTTLPVDLTFRLPGYIKDMHAVAVEQNGTLIDVNPTEIQLRADGDNAVLTFPASSLNVQFEYYDPVILTRQQQTRQLTFNFTVPYPIKNTVFEVQEPAETTEFSITPAANNTFTGQNGLKYHTVEVAGLTPADAFTLSATYQRGTEQLSAPTQIPLASTSPAPATTASPVDDTFNLGYWLIAVGVVLLLAAGAYWWWARRQQNAPTPERNQPNRRVLRQRGKTRTTGFCYRCGTPLRADASFCHACGAKRRGE